MNEILHLHYEITKNEFDIEDYVPVANIPST
jgi:hypothetical protein